MNEIGPESQVQHLIDFDVQRQSSHTVPAEPKFSRWM